MRTALALSATFLMLAACERATPAAEPAQPDVAVIATPASAPKAAPAPDTATVPQGEFDAISNTAMGVTGALTSAGGVLTFEKGQSYAIESVALARGADPYDASKASFASLINTAADAELRIFRVAKEDKGEARNGGLCGAESTTYVVAHQGVDSGGAPALFLVAFKSAPPPGATTEERDLCGTFMYAPKGG
jgi:hypothetical protein